MVGGWFMAALPAHAADDEVRVLILNGLDPYLPAYLAIDGAMRASLANETSPRIVLYAELLDAQHFPVEPRESEIVASIAKKYSSLHIDVVVTVTKPALDFFRRLVTAFPDTVEFAADDPHLAALRHLRAGGASIPVAQCNNIYIFPGVGLAVTAVRATRITDAMMTAAAAAVGDAATIRHDPHGTLLPDRTQLAGTATAVAKAVAKAAVADAVAPALTDDQIDQAIDRTRWLPRYQSDHRVASRPGIATR
jgi:hypothetical protein